MYCGCHLGYVNLKHLKLRDVFDDGLLERMPPSVLFDPALRGPASELGT